MGKEEVSRTTRFIGEEPVSSDSQQDETESDEYGAPTEMSVVGNAGDDSTAFNGNTSNEEEAVGERDSAGIVLERSIGLKHLKPKIVIRFRKEGSDEWSRGKIHSRAGKATPSSNKSKGRRNKYENWWTIQDLESGHIEPLDAEKFEAIEAAKETNEEEETVTYAVNVPRFRHGERKFVDAKQKELNNFDTFEVYEEVADIGQTRLGTNWVCTEKIKGDEVVAKA